jgi:hypothetical protein
MRLAASRTFCTAGNSSPMRMAMMAMTTRSSISVKPARTDAVRVGERVMRTSHKTRRKSEKDQRPGVKTENCECNQREF